jgi:hypothetical protein
VAEEIALHLTAFFASLIFVGLKAFQQRNVAFDNYAWVFPTSIAMAATEVYVVASVAKSGWHIWLVLAIGAGAGLGALGAMLIHKKWIRKQ